HRLRLGQRVHRGGRGRLLFRAYRARSDPLPHHHRGARFIEAAAAAAGEGRGGADMSSVLAPGVIDSGNALYRSRRRVNFVLLAISGVALAFGLFWLIWILGTLLYEGGNALARATLYYQMTPPPGSDGGIANAIVGSLIMV